MTTRSKIISLFEDELYDSVLEITNPYTNESYGDVEILYYIKSRIVADNFKIANKKEMKELLFYYFYLVWKVEFENNYSILFNKQQLKIHFWDLKENIYTLKDFSTYFDFWKNKHFLQSKLDKKTWATIDPNSNYKGKNIIDFFLYQTHECSELYAFSWEHFPLFKWLINELTS